uniref:Si:dkey-88l16.2 n=2 Tax=Nothobranchius TaxID=28779 RepID=A0A1A8MFK2_9TELE
MELTFSLRRKEIVSEEPLVDDVLKQWPALFLPDQVCAEFFQITQTNLTSRFFTSLDEYAPKIIKVYRASGAACGEGMKSLLEKLDDQTSDVLNYRKATALRGLPMFMDKHSGSLLKDCLDTEPVEDQINSMKMGILTVIEDDVATVQSSPNIRLFAVVLEEQIVVDEVSDLPTAFALLFGLIYALNMDYPKELKYSFETIQKVFMCLDPKCSARVQSFKNKLLQY